MRTNFLFLFWPRTSVLLRQAKLAKNLLCEVPTDALEVALVLIPQSSDVPTTLAVLQENPHLVLETGFLVSFCKLDVEVKDRVALGRGPLVIAALTFEEHKVVILDFIQLCIVLRIRAYQQMVRLFTYCHETLSQMLFDIELVVARCEQ